MGEAPSPSPRHPVQAEALWEVQATWGRGRLGPAGPAHLTLFSGAGTSRYAQIDITATEAAHRAGARHAQSREERLPELEQRRKGAPP